MTEGENCATLVPWGQLKSKDCEETFPYVCERSLGSPRKCAQGWEHFGDSCYKRYHHEKKQWDEARDTCQDDNADLIVVNSHFENYWLYDFANRDSVDIWLGLRENVIQILIKFRLIL